MHQPLTTFSAWLAIKVFAGLATATIVSAASFTIIDARSTGSTYLDGINNLGQIVGNSAWGGFVYADGKFSYPGFPGLAHGINDAGEVVGSFNDDKGTHGFLYSRGR